MRFRIKCLDIILLLAISPFSFPGISIGLAQSSCEREGRLIDVSEILRRMQESTKRRKELVQAYISSRKYAVEYKGIVKKRAEMAASMKYLPSGQKQYEIEFESGSKFLRNRVLHKLLESEVDAAQAANRQEVAISPENYRFRLLPDSPQHCGCYILEVVPLKKAKYLFLGKIWVDDTDFAITRIEAKPAVNPSWWIKETKILQTYRKLDGFWFMDSNDTTSKIRIGGEARLEIRYGNYEFIVADSKAHAQDPK
jgi:hypothetical protein